MEESISVVYDTLFINLMSQEKNYMIFAYVIKKK